MNADAGRKMAHYSLPPLALYRELARRSHCVGVRSGGRVARLPTHCKHESLLFLALWLGEILPRQITVARVDIHCRDLMIHTPYFLAEASRPIRSKLHKLLLGRNRQIALDCPWLVVPRKTLPVSSQANEALNAKTAGILPRGRRLNCMYV